MLTMQQLVIRVPDEMAGAIDALVEQGEFETRSEVVRAAIETMLDRHRRDEIGRQIIEGYERIPVTDEEMQWAEANAREMIEAEPW